MQARICDRCYALYVDDADHDIYVSSVIIFKDGTSHSDKVGSWDLCENCKKGLYEYLRPINEKSKFELR